MPLLRTDGFEAGEQEHIVYAPRWIVHDREHSLFPCLCVCKLHSLNSEVVIFLLLRVCIAMVALLGRGCFWTYSACSDIRAAEGQRSQGMQSVQHCMCLRKAKAFHAMLAPSLCVCYTRLLHTLCGITLKIVWHVYVHAYTLCMSLKEHLFWAAFPVSFLLLSFMASLLSFCCISQILKIRLSRLIGF